MKLKILFFAIIMIMIASCKSDSVNANEIILSGLNFSPKTLSVSVGTTVTWINKEAITHSVTSDTSGLFDSGDLLNGNTFKYTFSQAGTFPYHCKFHTGMTGTIIATVSATTTTGTGY